MQSPASTDEPLVSMLEISKWFGDVQANDSINFDIRRGEIHALLGENGAGKSTLMSILSGLYRPDAGTIRIAGKEVHLESPGHAIAQGVGMVHQHFMLVPTLRVAENIVLGDRHTPWILRHNTIDKHINDFAKQHNLPVNASALVWQCSVGEQQRVEIVKMLYRGAKVLVLDEPTAVLAPQETDSLFAALQNLKARGHGIVLIGHKLDEILRVADRLTIVRHGKLVAGGIDARAVTQDNVADLMIGHHVTANRQRRNLDPGTSVLELSHLVVEGDRGIPALRGLSLDVHERQIVGVAGVSGNGQSELAETIAGLRKVSSGQIVLLGQYITRASVRRRMDLGLASIPEDRNAQGIIGALSVADNLALTSIREAPYCRAGRLVQSEIDQNAQRQIERYAIAGASVATKAANLSGGNLQKLLIARELSRSPKLLVASHPTRGLDLGARNAVHGMLLSEREAGLAILLISEDLDEILAISDRVVVMRDGVVTNEVDATTASRLEIGQMMTGTWRTGRP